MSQATRNLLEGAVTFVVGLVLWLFTGGVETPVITLTKVGAVMMCVGGALTATGLHQAVRRQEGAEDLDRAPSWPQRSPPGTHSTSPTSLFAVLARMNSRSDRRLR
jgi:hypothetical protein